MLGDYVDYDQHSHDDLNDIRLAHSYMKLLLPLHIHCLLLFSAEVLL